MTCPHCRQTMRTGREDGAPVYVCLACNETVRILPPKPSRKQGKLPGLDPGRQEVNVLEAEKSIVERIRVSLQRAGYLVIRVGQLYANLGGNDTGCGDMLVIKPGWNRWVMGEVKTATGKLRPEQEWLHEQGYTFVWRNPEDALRCLEEIEKAMNE